MAQKRTNYSKFTRQNGTIQVLMLWASLALHVVIGSNLGLFGSLDPIKVKPAGGTVRVVDLTPAEQTRVPEAAKSRPLPIALTPVNPEPATRAPISSLPPRNSAASGAVSPRNRPQLPSPSSQFPRQPITQTATNPPQVPQPSIPTNPNSKKPELSLTDPKKQRPPQQEDLNTNNTKTDNNGQSGGRKKNRISIPEKDDSNIADPNNPSLDKNKKRGGNGTENPDEKDKDKIKPDTPGEEQKNLSNEVTDVIKSLRAGGQFPAKNVYEFSVPSNLIQVSPIQKYKLVAVIWPTDSDGELLEISPIIVPNKRSEYSFEEIAKTAKEAYRQFSTDKKKTLKDSTIVYKFKVPANK
jgi:hypothetical protein